MSIIFYFFEKFKYNSKKATEISAGGRGYVQNMGKDDKRRQDREAVRVRKRRKAHLFALSAIPLRYLPRAGRSHARTAEKPHLRLREVQPCALPPPRLRGRSRLRPPPARTHNFMSMRKTPPSGLAPTAGFCCSNCLISARSSFSRRLFSRG